MPRNLDQQYLRIAGVIAENSYANKLKVGALIVKGTQIISDGYNGTPHGFGNACEDSTGHTLPNVLHAEENAIAKLAKSSNNGEGSTIYITVAPCEKCARLLIQAGIKRVVFGEHWKNSNGICLLKQAGIEVHQYEMIVDYLIVDRQLKLFAGELQS